MKKILYGLIIVAVVSLGFYAGSNWARYLYAFHGGIKVGKVVEGTTTNKTGSYVLRLDSIITDNPTTPTTIEFWHNGVQLSPDIPASGYDNIYDFVPKLYPDTVAVSSSRALALTDANKRLRVTGAHITLTLPPSTDVAFVKETTIYVQMLSAGVLHIANGAGVTRYSVKDSANGNTQYKWYGIVYWGNNNYNLIGVED